MNKIKKIILLGLVLLISIGLTYASATDKKINNSVTIKEIAESELKEVDINAAIFIKDNFIKAKYASAESKFEQGNVRASYDDYNDIIQRIVHDDYVFLAYGIKMAEHGFFDLSDDLINKLDDNLYTENYVRDIKLFYYPSTDIKQDDLLYLSDAYAAIVYNNLAIETTSELINSNIILDSDYKNYLIALGYYKSNELQSAIKYIDRAITLNNVNLSYKLLKAKILADSNKQKKALALIKEVKNVGLRTTEFQDKVRCTEEYILYKLSTENVLKDYHLAYYYHLQGKSQLAIKVLKGDILQAKQYSAKIFSLLAKIYYDTGELIRAEEYASRAYKEDNKNYLTLQTLADINYENEKYTEALNYYKGAKRVSDSTLPIVGIAKTYLALNKDKKAQKLYEKLLKKHKLSEELLITSLKIFPHKAGEYLATIASLDVSNCNIWLSLAGMAISDRNYLMAETCLNNAYYIDENNYKYYYYLSLLYKANGDIEKSNKSLIRCASLNSEYYVKFNRGNIENEK